MPQMIQPNGFHLGMSSEWVIDAVSANVGQFLPCSAPSLLGEPITAVLCDDAIHGIRNRMALLRSEEAIEHLLHVSLVDDGPPFDISIYRDGEGFGIDAEPSEGHGLGDATGIVHGMLARLEHADQLETLCDMATRQLRALTGFDRAVIFGGGKLLGQSARAGCDQFSPTAASATEGEFAVADTNAGPVAILRSDRGGQSQSRSTLRLPDEKEAAALTALGAKAALVVPLRRDGHNWGHVGCYHGSPRHVGVERRSVVGLFARIIALKIEIAELRRG